MALEQIGLQAILDDKNFQSGLKRYTAGIGQMTSLTDGAASMISGAFKLAGGALLAGSGLAAAIGKVGFDFNAMREQAEIAFGTILGDGTKAKALLDELQTFAAATPFEFPELVDAGKKLLAFGFEAKDIVSIMTRLGDVSAGLNIPVSELADIYGKMRVQGRLFADDLNQLQGRGIPVSQMLAKQLGVQESAIRKMVEEGKIGFPEIEKVFKGLTEQGGKFSGMMAKQSQSFSGLMSTLKDNLTQIAGQLSKPIFDRATKWLKTLTDWLSSNRVQSGIERFADGLETVMGILDDLTGGRHLNALFRFYYLLEDIFGRETAKKIYDLMTAVGAFKDSIIALVQRLQGAFKVGGLAGLGGQIALELQKAWPAISVQLKTWGTQFWDWLTGPGGAIAQATGKIGEFAGKLGMALQQNWPTISAQFSGWATGFWDWLTGPKGALSQAAAKISEIAENIVFYLPDVWSKYIQPALMGWATQFWNWLTDPSGGVLVSISENMGTLATNIENWTKDPGTQARFREMGRTLARAVIDGIGSLFEQKGEGENLIAILFRNLWNAGLGNLRSFMNLGRALSEGVMAGIFSIFTDPQTATNVAQAITTMEQNAVNGVIAQLGNILQPLFTAIQTLISAFWASHPPSAPAAPAPYSPLPSGYSQFANGGWVNQTGMALVHRGEYVIPARQAQNISNNNSRSIGAVTVTIQGSTGMGASEIKKAVYMGIREVLEAA